MLNFLKKPLGFALILLIHGLIANQVYDQFFPNQLPPQFTFAVGIWSLVSMYVFLTTYLLYRLLIKQESFSKEFKKAASRYYAMMIVGYASIAFIFAKALSLINPELAQKLFTPNVTDFVNLYGWTVILLLTAVCLAIAFPIAYWINYGLLSLTNKIVSCFLKSKEA